ncbi:unnamed protein product [Rotaria sordida]|uniref:Uncharacterized protein n=1 Tax=Rotaria sordida TaxID=392033 RepID=A0A814SKM1_9BILA|nr:unnamed protein product [Rotaria sordida]
MYWFLMIGLFLLINNSIGCKRPSLSQITAQPGFCLEKFLGQWHQIKYYTSEKNHNPSDSWVDYSQFFALDNCINRHVLAFGRARLPNGKECFSFGPWSIFAYDGAKMIVETDDINKNTKVNWPYFISKTDYTHYALMYTCLTKGATRYDPCTEEVVEQDESSSIYMNCLAWNPMRTNEFCLDCSNDCIRFCTIIEQTNYTNIQL